MRCLACLVNPLYGCSVCHKAVCDLCDESITMEAGQESGPRWTAIFRKLVGCGCKEKGFVPSIVDPRLYDKYG